MWVASKRAQHGQQQEAEEGPPKEEATLAEPLHAP